MVKDMVLLGKRGEKMRDFPMFTTQNGVASLILKEIPYTGEAFITIQDSVAPVALLRDCVDFCKIAGAKKIYAKGHSCLEVYPLHTAIWQMSRLREDLPEADASLFPVTEKTISQWREIYNQRMKNVDNAATMTKSAGEKLLERGAGYYIHKNGELLGIGIAEGETVETVISVKPGAGESVMLALCSNLYSERILLEVASTNANALRLYDKLGFVKTAELSHWYDVTTLL